MNIFKTYVKRNLKNNRLRTTMTILGIILSVALVTAVIEGAFSGIEYARNVMKHSYGNHHGYAFNMTMDTAYELIQKDEIEAYTTFNTVGWSKIDSQNSWKQYLLVKEATEEIKDFLPINIIEGHFPENENEILLPTSLATNANIQYNVGDTITLTLSERYLDPEYYYNDDLSLDEIDLVQNGIIPESARYFEDERLLTSEDGYPVLTKTYTVCGVMERLPYTIEEYMCPGYIAIVKSTGLPATNYKGQEIPSYNVFFRVKDPVTYNIFHDTFEKEHDGVYLTKNRELVALYGGLSSRSLTFFISGFVAVLIGLILFGSISLVYNSFSISINERTKQIGIMKSVGATKKQIRKTIFYEAFFESIISIPLGILLGCVGMAVTFFLLEEGFTIFLGYFGGFDTADIKIQLVINVPLIIVAVLIVVVAVFLSAAIPALRASAVSPIDLVRQNADIKASGKIKKSRILSRIFGAEGMLASKNYSRNKKRYRSTIVSLAVSIILFIAASSFCAYLSSATESEVYTGNVDIVFYYYNALPETETAGDDDESVETNSIPVKRDYREIKDMLLSADDVSKVIATMNLYDYRIIDPGISVDQAVYEQNTVSQDISETDIENYADNPVSEIEPYTGGESDSDYIDPTYENHASIYFIDDESFIELLKTENIPVPQQKDNTWNAVVYNKGIYYTYNAENDARKVEYEFLEENDIPKSLKVKWFSEYSFPGLMPVDQVVDADGNIYVVYLDKNLVMDYYAIMVDDDSWRLVEEATYDEFRKYLDSIGKDSSNVGWVDMSQPVGIDGVIESISELGDDSKPEVKKSLSEKQLELISKCTFVEYESLAHEYDLNIIGITNNEDYALTSDAIILLPFSAMPDAIAQTLSDPEYYIYSANPDNSEASINNLLIENDMDTGGLYNVNTANVGKRMIGRIVGVFSYGFILLISLVAIANVFNTISTNVHLRRREFGMLKSMGLSNKGVTKILNIECLIYGTLSLLIGLPLSVPVTWGLYKITNRAFAVNFSIPWYSVVIAIGAVFIVVFVTMFYASGKIKKDNTLDAIRAENI